MKIHFDKSKRATGVAYERHGILGFASAKREIILSCGTINTPQLLMLSGIGPRPHLQEVGVRESLNIRLVLNC